MADTRRLVDAEGGARSGSNLSVDPDNLLQAADLRSQFRNFCILFSINHGAVTMPLAFATSVLADSSVANSGNGVLFIMTMFGTLFVGPQALSAIGPQEAVMAGMALYTLYVAGFALACSLEDGPALTATFIAASGIGGIGAGMLWPAQGVIFQGVAEKISNLEGKQKDEVLQDLAGKFAVIYLAFEVTLKAGGSSLKLAFSASHGSTVWSTVFYCLTGVAVLSVILMQRVPTLVPTPPPPASCTGKLTSAMSLWSDAKIWLLSFTNLAFGFAGGFINGYVNDYYVAQKLDTVVVGYFAAMIAFIAAVSSWNMKHLTKRIGQGGTLFLGSLCFLLIPVLVLTCDVGTWGYGVGALYILQGLGRGVYESTNKAAFGDFFPHDAPGAFANCMMQASVAFAVCFFLGASFKTESGGHTLAWCVASLALATGPGYAAASRLRSNAKAAAGSPL